VARQLYLSPATVATHVSHILEKLGFSSRVEVAAWIVERRLRRETGGPPG
jgi:non-specific serine/threonine protein kinase